MDARHLVRRLAELRDWAEYIHESLVRDQPYEEGKIRALLELAPANELEELRASSFFLAKRLSEVLARIARASSFFLAKRLSEVLARIAVETTGRTAVPR